MASVSYHVGGFPPTTLEWHRLIPLLGPASAALARYDGTLQAVPNANVLLSPLTTQEAVLSSRIEGTQATMGDVLEFEAGALPEDVEPGRREDIREVLNYRQALWAAVDLMRTLPLCQRVLKEAHVVLMEGVRGANKSPGEYRRIQNWIGAPGCPIEEARFVPIAPQDLPAGMGAWERYLHDETVPDALVQLALLHAEFEALHPFLDGNGRLGRMVIPLYLVARGHLSGPVLYMSAYLETHRDEYYERLLAVSRDGDWTDWCRFFLEALIHQADDNNAKARSILALYDEEKQRLVDLTHSQYAIRALDFVFRSPIFSAATFAHQEGIPAPTARRILGVMRAHGLVGEVQPASGRRAAVFAYRRLLNIVEGRDVF